MRKLVSLLLTVLMVIGLAAPALATYTPSIEAKPAPEVVPIVDPEGREAQAVIIDADGEETYVYPNDTLELVVTSAADKNHALLTEITDMLITAEYQVKTAETVSDLTTDMVGALQNYQNNSDDPVVKSLNIGDLCVTDIFDISLVLNGVTIYDVPEGCTVRIKLQTNLDPNKMYFILSDCYGTGWNIVNSSCQLDQNGVLTLTRDALCPFILIGYRKDAAGPDDDPGKKPDDPNKPHSPQTGETIETMEPIYLAGGVLFAVGAVICLCNARRKQKTEE